MNGLALCSGYGGLELALERFFPGYRTLCHVEGEAFAVSHLIKKMEEGRIHPAPIWDDLRTFEGDRWRGVVDIIAGGFPCQPFSTAGKQMASEDPRHLWPNIVQIVRQVRPRFLFFENVPGVVKWILDGILLDLASLGYDASWCVVRAADVGAPHSRARWFLFAETCNANGSRLEKVSFEKRGFRINRKLWENMEGFWGSFGGDCESIASESTDSKCLRWDENEYDPSTGELDVEGICGEVSDSDDDGLSSTKKSEGSNERGNNNQTRKKTTLKSKRLCSTRIDEIMADSNGLGVPKSGKIPKGTNGELLDGDGKTGPTLSDSFGERIQRQRGQYEKFGREESRQRNLNSDDKWDRGFGDWWEVEPSMGRLVDGASDWVDKLRLLGNGVVPQQAHYALTILTSTLPSWSGLHE